MTYRPSADKAVVRRTLPLGKAEISEIARTIQILAGRVALERLKIMRRDYIVVCR